MHKLEPRNHSTTTLHNSVPHGGTRDHGFQEHRRHDQTSLSKETLSQQTWNMSQPHHRPQEAHHSCASHWTSTPPTSNSQHSQCASQTPQTHSPLHCYCSPELKALSEAFRGHPFSCVSHNYP